MRLRGGIIAGVTVHTMLTQMTAVGTIGLGAITPSAVVLQVFRLDNIKTAQG